MRIEIIKVDVVNKGKYREAQVTYKGPEGKPESKKIMSFVFKDVFKALSDAKTGDLFDVKFQKNDKGYWDWTEVVSEGKNLEPTSEKVSKAVSTTRTTYETAEERARRAVYIARQSSLDRAIELAVANGQRPVTEEDIIASARKFEAYVMDIGAPDRESDYIKVEKSLVQ